MAKTTAWVFGVILLVVGVWGFFQNPVLGIFGVNTLHDIIHLVSGLLLIGAAMAWIGGARMWLIILGVVYAIVAIAGFVVPDLMMSSLNSGMADVWLHALLAIVFLVVGFMDKGEMAMSAPMGSM